MYRLYRKVFDLIFSARFIKFCLTGGAGTITNIVIFFILVDCFAFNDILSNVICFLIAVTQNYIINEKWTFNYENNEDNNISIKRWGNFIIASLLGYLFNILTYIFLILIHSFHYKTTPLVIGILVGLFFNYFLSAKIIFGAKRK